MNNINQLDRNERTKPVKQIKIVSICHFVLE